MKKEYNSNSEKEYTAPEAQLIVEPESSIPKWIKYPISCLVVLYLGLNSGGFFLATDHRIARMSKSKIEEKIDKIYSDRGDLAKFVFDDLPKPGRELAYSIFGDGEQEK
jgi:hypothetical protein